MLAEDVEDGQGQDENGGPSTDGQDTPKMQRMEREWGLNASPGPSTRRARSEEAESDTEDEEVRREEQADPEGEADYQVSLSDRTVPLGRVTDEQPAIRVPTEATKKKGRTRGYCLSWMTTVTSWAFPCVAAPRSATECDGEDSPRKQIRRRPRKSHALAQR